MTPFLHHLVNLTACEGTCVKEMSDMIFTIFFAACEEGQGICAHLLIVISIVFIFLTLPFSLCCVVKVVQVRPLLLPFVIVTNYLSDRKMAKVENIQCLNFYRFIEKVKNGVRIQWQRKGIDSQYRA